VPDCGGALGSATMRLVSSVQPPRWWRSPDRTSGPVAGGCWASVLTVSSEGGGRLRASPGSAIDCLEHVPGCVAIRSRVPASARQSQKCTRLVPAKRLNLAEAGNATCPVAGLFSSPLTDANRRPPPYHGTTQATGRNPRQRFSLGWAVLEAVPFASDCHGLRPLGSTKAPRFVAYVGYDARNWTISVGWSVR
jgi:hypothetical protein